MKKLILTLIIAFLITPACFASDNYVAYAGKSATAKQSQNLEKEVKNFFKSQLVYTNTGNIRL